MRRSISTLGLLLTSISAIVGSGWLFSAFYASQLAGPAALISWCLGGLSVIIIAFVFAEISAMLPITGSSTRIPQFTHGTMVSFTFAWIIWLSYLSLMATEVQAVLQYTSFFFPSLTHPNGGLTFHGYIWATILMFASSAINVYSLRWLIKVNNISTIIKVAIPVIIMIILLMHTLPSHSICHPQKAQFMPYSWHGVFSAMVSGGIIFAFNGFKQAADMAGEAKNPGRSVPLAILGSVFITLILFLFLQVGFLSSIEPSNLLHGWKHLTLGNDQSPYSAILKQEKIEFLMPLLYFGALMAPFAASLMYCAGASRSLYGMAKNGYVPKIFCKLSAHHHPQYAIFFNFILGMFMFAPLPGWNNMVSFMTTLLAITYSIGPICLLALRRQVPDQHRPLKLPFINLFGYGTFYLCTLLAYWCGWHIIYKMGIAVFGGYIIFSAYYLIAKRSLMPQLIAAVWLWPYIGGLVLFSYMGNYGGGHHILNTSQIMLLMAVFCGIILLLSLKFRLKDEVTRDYIKQLNIPHAEN